MGKIIIKSVDFLTPARVKLSVDDKDQELDVGVDLINRKVYEKGAICSLSEEIFQYLDDVNSLPEDFFRAPDDIYEQVVDAQSDLNNFQVNNE